MLLFGTGHCDELLHLAESLSAEDSQKVDTDHSVRLTIRQLQASIEVKVRQTYPNLSGQMDDALVIAVDLDATEDLELPQPESEIVGQNWSPLQACSRLECPLSGVGFRRQDGGVLLSRKDYPHKKLLYRPQTSKGEAHEAQKAAQVSLLEYAKMYKLPQKVTVIFNFIINNLISQMTDVSHSLGDLTFLRFGGFYYHWGRFFIKQFHKRQ